MLPESVRVCVLSSDLLWTPVVNFGYICEGAPARVTKTGVVDPSKDSGTDNQLFEGLHWCLTVEQTVANVPECQ